jgi:hypothetical protein
LLRQDRQRKAANHRRNVEEFEGGGECGKGWRGRKEPVAWYRPILQETKFLTVTAFVKATSAAYIDF